MPGAELLPPRDAVVWEPDFSGDMGEAERKLGLPLRKAHSPRLPSLTFRRRERGSTGEWPEKEHRRKRGQTATTPPAIANPRSDPGCSHNELLYSLFYSLFYSLLYQEAAERMGECSTWMT